MIYFIQQNSEENGYVKVGISKDPDQRIKTLQTGSPKKLCLRDSFWTPNDSKVEGIIHGLWSDVNLRGEWFNLAWYGWYHHVASLYSKVWEEIDKNYLALKCHMCGYRPEVARQETKLHYHFNEVEVVQLICGGCGFATPAFERGCLSYAAHHWNNSVKILSQKI